MTMDAMVSTRAKDIRRVVGIAVVFTLFVAVVFGFGFYLFALVVAVMRESLGFAYAAIGTVTGGAQIAFLVAALLCPLLANRFGGGQVIVGGVTASALLLLLFSRVHDISEVGAVLAGLGAAAAFMVIPTIGVISRHVPFAYRSRVNALVSSGTAYGQFANGILVPWLLPAHGWRVVWLVTGSVALAITLSGVIVLRLLAAEVFVREIPPRTEYKIADGHRQRLVTSRNLTVWILLALSGMACGPWQNYLSSFLADERGRSLETIGRIWSIIGLLGLFSGFVAGMAADKIGVRISLALSYGALACSALLIAFNTGVWQLQMAAICFGLSFYAVYGLIPAYISKTADPRAATSIFAVANVFLGLGTTLGNVVGGYIPAWYGSLQGAYIATSVVAGTGMILTTLLQDERRLSF